MGWVGDVWSMEQVEEAKEHHTLVYITRMCQNKPELQKICETETASVFFTGTGTVHKSGACISCFADILSAPSEAEKPKIGVCFCRGRAGLDCFVFYAGKYGTEHDLCIKRWHHRCMCPVLCSRYGRILFLRMRNQACGFTSDL